MAEAGQQQLLPLARLRGHTARVRGVRVRCGASVSRSSQSGSTPRLARVRCFCARRRLDLVEEAHVCAAQDVQAQGASVARDSAAGAAAVLFAACAPFGLYCTLLPTYDLRGDSMGGSGAAVGEPPASMAGAERRRDGLGYVNSLLAHEPGVMF